MFSLHDFIMETLKGMHGNYPDFQIREYALNWYGKGKLTEEDLAEIELMLEPPVEETTEEIVTEEPIELVEEQAEEPVIESTEV